MRVYRVEELEYDYSPTLVICDSFDKAAKYLTDLGAKYDGEPHSSWTRKGKYLNQDRSFAINELELNIPGESRVHHG